MGIATSVMSYVGLPVKLSSLADKIFDQFFSKDIKNFEQFHSAYLDLCNKFNSTMLGQHYEAPQQEKIKQYFEKWNQESDKITAPEEKKKKRKELLIEFLMENVKISHTDQSVVMTGLVVPPAAMMLKKNGGKIPGLKNLLLDVIPDYLFVPAVTLVALFGVKVVSQRNISSKPVA
uniref:Ribonuclease Y n=1 Tax=Anthurium amnicola TaxID=1678845 RepID=A0A1D1XS38_9ARAE